MMVADAAPPSTDSAPRRRWVIGVTFLLLLAVIMLVALHPDLRALAGDTWREMRSLSPAALTAIVIFKTLQALFSALAWRNVLRATWPNAHLSYRFVLGVDQAQDVLNTVAPARAGTWTMLGILGLAIRGARVPTLLAVWGVQNLAFIVFAAINSLVVVVGLPEQSRERGGALDRLAGFAASQPLLAGAIAAGSALLLVGGAIAGRRRLAQVRRQLRDGLVILGTPERYVRLVFVPALASYLCRCAAYGLLLAAFGIPVSIWTLALALSSHALANAVRITPGGVGTTQVLDVVALRPYAAPEVVTAYSLSEIAITAVVSAGLAVAALLSVGGWRGVRVLLGRRGDIAASLQTLGHRQRALRERALRRR
jgi:hypothetical protein